MGIDTNEISDKANGGTELVSRAMAERIDPKLLEQVQIIPSRVRDLDPTKIRILHLHDLPGDPESDRVLGDGGWQRFHKLVFVSNWQMQRYIERYGLPWSHCAVVQNAIVPFEPARKPDDPQSVRLVYHSTPHRGLDILAAVMDKLVEEGETGVQLDVFSSFRLYGWEERDEPFAELFDRLRANPAVQYHGVVSNERVREAVAASHIFAYPSTWPETSCLCLIEAMAAGCLCVHPNYGALAETASNWTAMYQFDEDKNRHASIFHAMLKLAVAGVRRSLAGDDEGLGVRLANQAAYTNSFYDWEVRRMQWEGLIAGLLHLPREISQPEETFRYEVR